MEPTTNPPAACLQNRLITELVTAQATATPEAVALTSATRVLSYRDLEERANALGEVLRALGVGPDVVVGLCAPRSPGMIVAALGILKAGGAYLPLDPTYPAARLAFVLQDAQVRVVVSGDCVKDRVPAGSHHTILLDDLGRLLEPPRLLHPGPAKLAATSKDLAYVIYTSGSTGQPKGVEITHQSLSNLVHWHQDAFQVTAADAQARLRGWVSTQRCGRFGPTWRPARACICPTKKRLALRKPCAIGSSRRGSQSVLSRPRWLNIS